MTPTEPTWAVVATVDEHPDLVRTFVAWHLHLGASEVHLYFDRPDDPAAKAVCTLPQVQITMCDTAHWQRVGKRRPDKHQIRQMRNATQAYARTKADWLLHSDADEYLWPASPVTAQLAGIDADVEGVVVPVAERCFVAKAMPQSAFAGVFRRPAAAGKDRAQLTQRGLTGHVIGKTFTRAGLGCEIFIHRPQRAAPPVVLGQMPQTELLHFDGLTRLQWVYKLLRKADAFAYRNGMAPSAHRAMQIDAILHDPQAAFALHDQLKVLSPAQSDDLARQGLLLTAGFDPTAALQAVFGAGAPPTSADLDAWLCAQKAHAFPLLAELTR